LDADSVVVVLSNEVNRMELYNLKRSTTWNFIASKAYLNRLKEVLKDVLNRPYSAQVFYQRWQTTLYRIM